MSRMLRETYPMRTVMSLADLSAAESSSARDAIDARMANAISARGILNFMFPQGENAAPLSSPSLDGGRNRNAL